MRPDELDASVAVWRAANTARGKSPSAPRVARVRAKLIEPAAASYVATVADEIVGMALAEPGRAEDGQGPVIPGLLHISMVFVSPPAQRQGVGGALMRHVFEVQAAAGMTTVTLWTGEDNSPARRLYESTGMRATRTRQVADAASWVRYEASL
jgi:ribosomal protein S18 acetylase RimI-like enzyme